MKLDGYLGASIDSVVFDSSVVNVYLYTGNQYNINKLTIYDETGLHILYQYIQPHLFKAKKHPNFITDIYEEFITKYENRGYPFSSIIPDTVNIESNSISISSRIWKGDQYVFNRVIIKGTTGISDKYIGQYLSIKMNDPYNEEKVKQIQDKINGLNFMTLIKKPDIEFREGKVDVYIYMKEKKSNLFSGILGLIPKSVDNESFHLTGDIKILLLNNINLGEQLALNWIGGIQNNQKLDLRLKIPYLFNSPIGVETFFFLE
jgi:outer membrane protein assembly factor BamA